MKFAWTQKRGKVSFNTLWCFYVNKKWFMKNIHLCKYWLLLEHSINFNIVLIFHTQSELMVLTCTCASLLFLILKLGKVVQSFFECNWEEGFRTPILLATSKIQIPNYSDKVFFCFLLTNTWKLSFFLTCWKFNTHLFIVNFAIPIHFIIWYFIFWMATYYQILHCIFLNIHVWVP